MREIKFRGKSIKDGKWYYGYFLVNKWGEYIICGDDFCEAVIPETVGQFTGLLDKNKTEIYEGDVVKWLGHEVSFENGKSVQLRPERKLIIGDFLSEGFRSLSNLHSHGVDYVGIEVIGNIYSNPELLETS